MCAYLLHQGVIPRHVCYPSIEFGEVMMNTKIILRFWQQKCTMIYIYWTVKVLPNHWALCIHGKHTYRFNQPYFLDRKYPERILSGNWGCSSVGWVPNKYWAPPPAPQKPKVGGQRCRQAGRSDVQGHLWLPGKLKASLGFVKKKNPVSEEIKSILFWSRIYT